VATEVLEEGVSLHVPLADLLDPFGDPEAVHGFQAQWGLRNGSRESFIGVSCPLASGVGNDRAVLLHWGAMTHGPPLASRKLHYLWSTIGLVSVVGLGAVAPVQEPDAKRLYGQYCANCHGPAGAGDGPLANAIKPRPASFADSAFQATRSDQQLVAAITAGKIPMPAFGKLLSPAQVKALVAYIRLLRRRAK